MHIADSIYFLIFFPLVSYFKCESADIYSSFQSLPNSLHQVQILTQHNFEKEMTLFHRLSSHLCAH